MNIRHRGVFRILLMGGGERDISQSKKTMVDSNINIYQTTVNILFLAFMLANLTCNLYQSSSPLLFLFFFRTLCCNHDAPPIPNIQPCSLFI